MKANSLWITGQGGRRQDRGGACCGEEGPAGRTVASKAKGSIWKEPGFSRYLRWSEM